MTGRSRWLHLAQLAALVLVLLAIASCSWFRLTGGHWERVESPSMGTTAPVGTLLWVRPVDRVHAGDVVTFHQPDTTDGPRYSHRVRAVAADGSFQTRGDLSGDDQWTVQPDDLVGRVQMIWPGVGRLVQAAPVLVIGGLVTAGAVMLTRRRGKLPTAMLGASLTLAVAIVVYQPLIGAQLLGSEPAGRHAVEATYVSTGLLPVRISAPGEGSVVLHPGQDGSVTTTRVVEGRLSLDIKPDVPLWFWLGLVLGSFAPAVGTAAFGSHERPAGRRVALTPA